MIDFHILKNLADNPSGRTVEVVNFANDIFFCKDNIFRKASKVVFSVWFEFKELSSDL